MMVDFRDQGGAAEPVWAYSIGPKSDPVIRRRRVVCELLCDYLCVVVYYVCEFFAVLRAGSILRGG